MASKIRDRIIVTAVKCFAAHGYAGCSTKEIASRANVTEGSLFRLFGSKDKLFAEVLERVRDEMLPQADFDRALHAGRGLLKDVQRAFVLVYQRLSVDGTRLGVFAILEDPDRAREIVVPLYEGRLRAVAKRLRTAIARGEVRKNIDVKLAALSLHLAVRNLGFDSLFMKRSKRAQLALLDRLVAQWVSGLQK
jgi:AcrR family transcriptional regulator